MLPIEVLIYVFLVFAVLWPALLTHLGEPYHQYESAKGIVMMRLHPIIFVIVWPILYCLITAAIVVYSIDIPLLGADVDAYYISIISLFFFNLSVNHYWGVSFFRHHMYVLAFLLAVALLLSALVVEILFAIKGEWTPFGLYMPYVLWLILATILSAEWMIKKIKLHNAIKKLTQGYRALLPATKQVVVHDAQQ